MKIYLEQLREGKVWSHQECYTASNLELEEPELHFSAPISVEIEASLPGDELLIKLNLSTVAVLPCKICNQETTVDIKIDNLYHNEPLEAIKGGIYCFTPLLREMILLQVPDFAECQGGACPNRGSVEKYLRKEGVDKDEYQPFKELNF